LDRYAASYENAALVVDRIAVPARVPRPCSGRPELWWKGGARQNGHATSQGAPRGDQGAVPLGWLTYVLLALALVAPGTGLAQETTGAITGRIVDDQGLGLPGAGVTVIGAQGQRRAVTDANGVFRVSSLTPGTYSVQMELQGFKELTQDDIPLSLGQTVNLQTLLMQVGGLTERVELVADPPVIDARTTTVGATVDSDLLQRIPGARP
jgi:hypothetical protein